jgi:FkbM family methyltransferase
LLDLSLKARVTRLVTPSLNPRRLVGEARAGALALLRRWQRRIWPLRACKVTTQNGAARTVHCRTGTTDYACVRQIFVERQYALNDFKRGQEIAEFVARRSQAGERPLIIDAGANIGASAVFFAMTYPNSLVLAIEPDASNFELLCNNAKGFDIRCLNAGLSSSHGRLKVSNPGAAKWAFQTEITNDGSGIPCVTISQIYEQECGPGKAFPFIVKIDIEGAEADVFARNVGWLAKTPIVIIELHDWLMPKSGSSAGFFRCIAGEPRDIITLGENVFAIAHSLD